MKKLRLTLLFVLAIFAHSIFGQSSYLDKFVVASSDETHLASTPDGGWLVSYSIKTENATFLHDAFQVVKYSIGFCQEIEWSKEYQFGGTPINVGGMLRHSSGDIFLTGTVNENEAEDLFLLKLNEDGSPAFFKTYSRPFRELVYTLDENPSGNLMLFGITYSNSTTSRNYFLTIDPQGNIVQATRHGEAGIWGRGLACSDGGYIGRMGGQIFKVDSEGNQLWSNFYAGIANSSPPVEVEGGYIFADSKIPSVSFEPHLLFKLDYNGDFVWISNTYQAKGYASLELLPNGNVLCLDSYYDDANPELFEASFIEFTPAGEQVSNQKVVQTYGLSSATGRAMEVLPDGSVLFSSLSGAGRDTLYIGKTDLSRDFGCGTVENLNEELNPTLTYTIISIPSDEVTFDINDYNLEVFDFDISVDPVCNESEVSFPTPPADTTICDGEEVVLRIDAPGAVLEWNDGSTADSLVVNTSGDYEVTVSVCGESMKLAPTTVIVEECPCDLVTPNAFTPDGDGENDIFRVLTTCELSTYQMQIWNRWGDLVFSSSNPNVGWNGLIDGLPAVTDSYIYRYSYLFEGREEHELVERKGNVTLIR